MPEYLLICDSGRENCKVTSIRLVDVEEFFRDWRPKVTAQGTFDVYPRKWYLLKVGATERPRPITKKLLKSELKHLQDTFLYQCLMNK